MSEKSNRNTDDTDPCMEYSIHKSVVTRIPLATL